MKMKKFGIVMLGLASVLALGSCNKKPSTSKTEGPNPTSTPTVAPTTAPTVAPTERPQEIEIDVDQEELEQYPDVKVSPIDSESEYRYVFSNAVCDAAACKKLFYVGEEFNYDNLKVYATYFRYDKVTNQMVTINGSRTEMFETKYYSIDTSEVDTNTVGTYWVAIKYRVGNRIIATGYTVEVKESMFATTPDISYCAGLKVRFKAGTPGVSSDGIVQTLDVEVGSDKKFNYKDLTYYMVTRTNDANCEYTETESQLAAGLKIKESNVDFSQVDYNKVGTYTVRVTYKASDVTISSGVNEGVHENVVVALVLVNVINPPTSVQKISTGDTIFESTASVMDYSNWKFNITRKVNLGAEELTYSPESFTVSGINQYVPGNYTASVKFLEEKETGGYISIDVPVTVVESTTQKIDLYNELTYGMKYSEEDEKWENLAQAKVLAPLSEDGTIKAYDITRELKSKQYEDGTNLPIRMKLNSSAAYLEVNMKAPGKIVLYAASSGDPREFWVNKVDENGDVLDTVYEDVVQFKDGIERFEIEITEAGSYRIANPASIYVYGLIVATAKEGK